MRQNKKNKGFTLVELLIVVAIIGILAAVLTPQFLNARKVAVDKAAEAYVHNVYTAVQAHIIEVGSDNVNGTDCKNGWPPSGLTSSYPVASTGTSVSWETCSVGVTNDDIRITWETKNGKDTTTEKTTP